MLLVVINSGVDSIGLRINSRRCGGLELLMCAISWLSNTRLQGVTLTQSNCHAISMRGCSFKPQNFHFGCNDGQAKPRVSFILVGVATRLASIISSAHMPDQLADRLHALITVPLRLLCIGSIAGDGTSGSLLRSATCVEEPRMRETKALRLLLAGVLDHPRLLSMLSG